MLNLKILSVVTPQYIYQHAPFLLNNNYITLSSPSPASATLSPGHNGSETILMMLKRVKLPIPKTS